jgi:endonuclease/exonuclease/phosphatase family metal-dependent hydrolase
VFNAKTGRHTRTIAQSLKEPPLRGAALIFLCELDWRLQRSGMREIAAELADEFSMSVAFCPEFALRVEGIDEVSMFGNAILSVFPLQNVERVPISNLYDWAKRPLQGIRRRVTRFGGRAGMKATVSIGSRQIALGLAHLENRAPPAGRAQQMRELLAALPPRGPALVGGDLNTITTDLKNPRVASRLLAQFAVNPMRLRRPQRFEPLFDRLQEAGFETSGANLDGEPTFTWSTLIPTFLRPKLDWIAYRELKPLPNSAVVVRASKRGRRFSDHDFIACRFEL